MTTIFLIAALIGVTVIASVVITFLLLKVKSKPQTTFEMRTVAEQVRSVGKLVGLEVHAKEIATATRGWGWMPPMLVSQARLAMIFQFEKQYYADLSLLTGGDVEHTADGEVRIRMPEVEGKLHLLDVQPYDIQQGRVLGLLDVMPMNADRQSQLMVAAQKQAALLFGQNDERFRRQAQRAIERELKSLLEMLGLRAELSWPEAAQSEGEKRERVLREAEAH